MRLVVAATLVLLAAVFAACSGVIAVLALFGFGFGAWMIVVSAAGGLLAFVLHAWYEGHPSALPAPGATEKPSPQINFSSTVVAGDVGGLIFAVGSVLIAGMALPSVMWFVFAATVGGGLVGWGLRVWHTSRANRGLPGNRISP